MKRELEHRSARCGTISRAALRGRSVEVPVRAHDHTSGWSCSVAPVEAVQHRIIPGVVDLEHGSLLRGTSRYRGAVKVAVRIVFRRGVRQRQNRLPSSWEVYWQSKRAANILCSNAQFIWRVPFRRKTLLEEIRLTHPAEFQ